MSRVGGRRPTTVSWTEFSEREPELARFGAARLTAAPAYIATIRGSGLPRVHPVTPIVSPFGLFLFMEPTSPKARDLLDREWYALHNGVPDDDGSGGEFHVSGRGLPIDDRVTRSLATDAASYAPADRHLLFEMLVGEARCHGYGDVELPAAQKWSADG